MVVDNPRFGAIMSAGATIASGMRELQTDQRDGFASEEVSLFINECFPKLRQPLQCVPGNHKLIRIRSANMRNCYGFATPNQARTGLREALPTTPGQVGWISICRTVPAFHGLNRDAVSQLQAIARQRLPQGGVITADEFLIAGNRYVERANMFEKAIDSFQASDSHDRL